jgi:hypothetical protein
MPCGCMLRSSTLAPALHAPDAVQAAEPGGKLLAAIAGASVCKAWAARAALKTA